MRCKIIENTKVPSVNFANFPYSPLSIALGYSYTQRSNLLLLCEQKNRHNLKRASGVQSQWIFDSLANYTHYDKSKPHIGPIDHGAGALNYPP